MSTRMNHWNLWKKLKMTTFRRDVIFCLFAKMKRSTSILYSTYISLSWTGRSEPVFRKRRKEANTAGSVSDRVITFLTWYLFSMSLGVLVRWLSSRSFLICQGIVGVLEEVENVSIVHHTISGCTLALSQPCCLDLKLFVLPSSSHFECDYLASWCGNSGHIRYATGDHKQRHYAFSYMNVKKVE